MPTESPDPTLADAPARMPRLDHFLCFAIYAAGHAFNRVYKPLLEAIGLTYPQYLVMVALWEQDDLTVGTLGARLSLESSTLTPLLKRLEAMGHLARCRDSKDERVVRVRLTAQGQALRQKASHIPGCILAASGLRLEDLVRLQQEITALRTHMEQAASGHAPAGD
ncbi:MarR family winged helix-turn-helix transcriptional regulator [Xanthobacter agilis]|uniref:DNA-binding MarR family transcriptional regulator n=1 Tax=Xanthobacter agilis TaxID=47492 RepID=A0ABU0L950_XANAG|nr:MarR family transcriptional regulator [Xanthobacter agilis]MDQ0503676.1 DNA-binding MarR family transcriptional regulator [Xanthobacter agilis]